MKKIVTLLAIASLFMAVGCKNNSKAPKIDVNTVDTTVFEPDSTYEYVDCSCEEGEDSLVVNDTTEAIVDL